MQIGRHHQPIFKQSQTTKLKILLLPRNCCRTIMTAKLVVAFVLVSCCNAGFFPDPFAGSNCTCETFCNYKCSINATKPQNVSLFRMTPNGVLDLVNKNTGDDKGDVGFVISRRTTAFYCKSNPKSFHCTGMTQFDGDDSNNTDLVLELKIEVNGQWGPCKSSFCFSCLLTTEKEVLWFYVYWHLR